MKDITIEDRLLGQYCLWCDSSENLKLVDEDGPVYLCLHHQKERNDMKRAMKWRGKIVSKARKRYFENKNNT